MLRKEIESKNNQEINASSIDIVNAIDGKTFKNDYVKRKRPVIIRGVADKWPAFNVWDVHHFSKVKSDIKLPIKMGDISKGEKTFMSLFSYAELLLKYEENKAFDSSFAPPYLHDVPIFLLLPELIKDIDPFPIEYFPPWYRDQWWSFVQFFMGGANSFTPLHFDTLYTHNLFFQVFGKKKFYIVDGEYRDKCYMRSWRWSNVNLEDPDYIKFPLLREVQIQQALVGPGDILYMPPGTLHQVHGLSQSISFNIDWHTHSSVRSGLFSGFKGAPKDNVYYNFIVAMGLYFKIPSKRLFPFYKSYLNYVS